MSSSPYISDSAIPYTVQPRSDTGLFNAKLGIWLFLASEVMLFGALFSSYILLRLGAHDWPRGASILNVPIGAFNTVVLISSSVTMVMAWASLKMNDVKKYRLFMSWLYAPTLSKPMFISHRVISGFYFQTSKWQIFPGLTL